MLDEKTDAVLKIGVSNVESTNVKHAPIAPFGTSNSQNDYQYKDYDY